MSLSKVPTLFKCVTCGKEYAKRSSLKSHSEAHNDVPHACHQCDKKYKRRSALREHKLTAHAEAGQFECDKCGKLCPHKRSLYDHKLSHKKARKGKLHECDQCEKKFKWRAALLTHKRTAHTEARQFECNKCGKLCPHRRALNDHKRSIHSDREFECPTCGKKMRQRSSFSHMKTHAGSRFTCDSECGLHSATRSEYRDHLRRQHILQHLLTCKCASVDVKRAQQVAKHLGQTAFEGADGTMKCTDGGCDFATTCARQMESHKEQRHHDACPSSLKSHNADKHQGERRFKCGGCGYITYRKGNLNKHQTSCRQGKVETQLQLIDEAFKQLLDCCQAPMTTGLTVAAVQKAPAVKQASVEPSEALVAACLKKQASAQRSQQAPKTTGMSSLFYTAPASTHHGQPTANTAASSLSSASDGSHQ